MKLKIIDYFTYKKLNYDSVFDDSHNDSYRIYGKLVEGNFYAKNHYLCRRKQCKR